MFHVEHPNLTPHKIRGNLAAMALTTEKAREMAIASHLPESARHLPELTTQNEAAEAEKFRLERLARVRRELRRLDKLLAMECDPAKLDRLVAALNRLQDAEGWLAGRFKMGQVKPKESKPARRYSLTHATPEPEPEPEPIAPPADLLSRPATQ